MLQVKTGLLVGCASVGIGAATLWSAHGVYLTSASVALSAVGGHSMNLAKAASIVNSKFYRAHFLSGGASCLLTSMLFLFVDPRDVLAVLFPLLTIVGSVGMLVLAALLPADAESDAIFTMPFVSLISLCRSCYSALKLHIQKWRQPVRPVHESAGTADASLNISATKNPPPPIFVSQRGFLPVESFSVISRPEIETNSGKSVAATKETLTITPTRPPTLFVLLKFMVSNRRMLILSPTIITMGAAMGLFNTIFFSGVVADGPGLVYLGFVGAIEVGWPSALSCMIFFLDFYHFVIAIIPIELLWQRYHRTVGVCCQ